MQHKKKSPTMFATTTLSKQPLFSTLRRGLFQSSGSRCLNTVAGRPDRTFHMAVIGAGPAGFYTAYRVLSKLANAKVDMYESLPVPYGLVRFGVAPDHPEVKVPSSPSLPPPPPIAHHTKKRPRTVKTNSTRSPKTHASRTSETPQSAHPGHTRRTAASH